jgi:HPt (histidine-containing phosphotransfer) domain-containing protein
LAELESALEAGDWSQAAIVAHGFKGSIAYIWPDHPVVELCANMEKWADAGERERLSKGVQELRAAVESLIASAAIA